MPNYYFECEKTLVSKIDAGVILLPEVELLSRRIIGTPDDDHRTFSIKLKKKHAICTLHIVVGSDANPVGPYDGLCWVDVTRPFSIFGKNERFCNEIAEFVADTIGERKNNCVMEAGDEVI